MSDDHQRVIRQAFAAQAKGFERLDLTWNRPDALGWAVPHLNLTPALRVLDVGGGTGQLGRAIAPHVDHVTVLDLTIEMLEVGRQTAAAEGITNMSFEEGDATRLPYSDGAFDMAASRLLLHHTLEPQVVVSEMARVTRSGGQVAVIDMITSDDPAMAEAHNRVERVRDPSHVCCMTLVELEGLLVDADLPRQKTVRVESDTSVEAWLDLTKAPAKVRADVLRQLKGEVDGPQRTGMRPFVRNGELRFHQRTALVVGRVAPAAKLTARPQIS